MSVSNTGPNPMQLSNTDAAVPMERVLHPLVVVGSHRGLLKVMFVTFWLHCSCADAEK